MKQTIDKNTVLVASDNQVSADLSADAAENIVVLGLNDGIYYELKEVAARIWELVQQPRSFQEVLDKILEEYEVSTEQCERDLLALIESLSSRGLLEIKASSAV